MKKIYLLLSGLMLLCLSTTSYAEVVEPDVLIKQTVREVLDVLRKDKDIRSGNYKKVLELIDAKILPHFDFEYMTSLTIGKKKWEKMTPEQQRSLITEFRILMVRTYTKSLVDYRDQAVVVQSPTYDKDGDAVVKTSVVNPHGQQPILVDYYMRKTPEGWKVYDMTVEGLVLVYSKKKEFDAEIRENGIDGLIKKLATMNGNANNSMAQKTEAK